MVYFLTCRKCGLRRKVIAGTIGFRRSSLILICRKSVSGWNRFQRQIAEPWAVLTLLTSAAVWVTGY